MLFVYTTFGTEVVISNQAYLFKWVYFSFLKLYNDTELNLNYPWPMY